MKVHPQSRLALSMPTRRHIAFSPFEAQRAPHEGSVPYVNGKRFHADVCGEIAENRARKKAAVCVEHTPCGGLQVLRVVRGSTEVHFSIYYLCASVGRAR